VIPSWAVRWLPHLLAACAVIAAVAWIDHRGYERAREDAEHDQLVTALMIELRAQRIEQALSGEIAALDRSLAAELAGIEHVETTIVRPAIEREIRNDPRLSDPAAGIGDGLREAINVAIRKSADPAGAARRDR
jgi:hypothetical protein